jgi:uncharacterized OsmC-like protein
MPILSGPPPLLPAWSPTVTVRRGEGKQLRSTIGAHSIVTDRKSEDGGADAGCTSAELLLTAIGSCAAGSIRNHLASRGIASERMTVEVGFRPAEEPGARNRIVVRVSLPAEALRDGQDGIRRAAAEGGVVSRIALGSAIDLFVCEHAASETGEAAA